MVVGISLIILGVILLLERLGLITDEVWGYFWPGILITMGMVLVWRRTKSGKEK